jgi:hypothetical protein
MHNATVPFPDYSFYSTDNLLAAFSAGPARLRHAIEGLTESELRARPRGPNKWSIHEIVIHTAESEVQGTFRIRKVWSEPPQTLPVYDQDVWAKEIDYQGQDRSVREGALHLLELLRQQTAPLFRRATDHDWAKWGTHPQFGRVTLRNLLELYADHVERHIDQVLDSRARLNRPLPMESLLSRRLY